MLHGDWWKSSYSTAGGDCLEARVATALRGGWRKSSYSGGSAGACVEARATGNTVLVRDTQNRGAGHLAFPGDAWQAFLAGVEEL
jgi:hypothetical protein